MKAVSDYLLERYNLDEVTPEERGLVEGEPSSEARLSALRKSDAEIRVRYAELLAKSSAPRSTIRRWLRVKRVAQSVLRRPRVWAAAVLAFALTASVYYAGIRGEGQLERAKGAVKGDNPRLFVYLKTGSEPLLLSEKGRASLSAGDTVQLAYNAGSESVYGVIFSIDGRRSVTLHYPYTESGSALLETGRNTALDEAYTLDDAPLFETFFLVTSKKPLNAAEILAKARSAAKENNSEAKIKQAFSKYELVEFVVDKK